MLIDSLDVIATLARLTENQREALIDSVVLERTDKDIAATMGVSAQRVGHLRRTAIKRMRGTRLAAYAA